MCWEQAAPPCSTCCSFTVCFYSFRREDKRSSAYESWSANSVHNTHLVVQVAAGPEVCAALNWGELGSHQAAPGYPQRRHPSGLCSQVLPLLKDSHLLAVHGYLWFSCGDLTPHTCTSMIQPRLNTLYFQTHPLVESPNLSALIAPTPGTLTHSWYDPHRKVMLIVEEALEQASMSARSSGPSSSPSSLDLVKHGQKRSQLGKM